MESSVFLSDLLTAHEPELRNSLQCRRATFRFMERIPRNFRALDPEPGRDGALRRPRRAQRRNDAARCFAGGDIAARCPYQSQVPTKVRSLPKSGSWRVSTVLQPRIWTMNGGARLRRALISQPQESVRARRSLAPPGSWAGRTVASPSHSNFGLWTFRFGRSVNAMPRDDLFASPS